MIKKAPGRPRKISKDLSVPPLTNCNLIIDDATLTKKPVPILQGEIIRLQRTSELVDSSDSEVDIDCSDDEEERTANKSQTISKENLQSQSSSDDPSVIIKNEIQETKILETPALPPQSLEPFTKYAQEDKSECESSETDSKNPDAGLMDAEPPQSVFTFPTPLEERIVAFTVITDEEKTIQWDFFGVAVQEWRKVKPRYLTKTSVRPSLKNCGDVNCISRVHAYLELTGAINFGCGMILCV